MKIKYFYLYGMLVLFLLSMNGCSKSFELQSYAFANNEPIPEKYWHGDYAERENISIPFNWINPPVGTQSFALIMRETGIHNEIQWAVFNIPADCTSIPENASGNNMPAGSIELSNHRRTPGYFGPEPIRQIGTFEYMAVLYALNTAAIHLNGYISYLDLCNIMDGNIIAKAEIVGTALYKK
jgi:Raf kinase inhibitor-like YbhB/YbcL family protein